MSKKQFDHIENKIREAAANSDYAFDEKAWSNMETLLENNRKKRRGLFWWYTLPLVLLLGGGYFLWHNNSANEQTAKQQDKTIAKIQNNISGKIVNSPIASDNNQPGLNESKINQSVIDENKTINKTNANHGDIISLRQKAHVKYTITSGQIDNDKNNVTEDTLSGLSTQQDKNPLINNNIVAISKQAANDTSKKIATVSSTTGKEIVAKPGVTNEINKKKTSISSAKGFYLLAVAGADAADVKLLSFNNSTITPRVGLGLGYQLNNKISIQSGFYSSHKKYIAGPGDYKASPGSYLATVDITKVNANCLVYEIPVTVRYNFIQNKKITYYATAGISSFIMKNEAYNYYFIDNSTAYQESKTYTGNKNFFSVAGFSVGIEKQLSDKFSLLGEPSVSIPIAGVGAGSIKLYSTDLMIGLKYHFSKK